MVVRDHHDGDKKDMTEFDTLGEDRNYKPFIIAGIVILAILGIFYIIYKITTITISEPVAEITCTPVSTYDCSNLTYDYKLALVKSGVGNPNCNCRYANESFK